MNRIIGVIYLYYCYFNVFKVACTNNKAFASSVIQVLSNFKFLFLMLYSAIARHSCTETVKRFMHIYVCSKQLFHVQTRAVRALYLYSATLSLTLPRLGHLTTAM